MKRLLMIIPLVMGFLIIAAILIWQLLPTKEPEIEEAKPAVDVEAEKQSVEKIIQAWIDMFMIKDLSMIDDVYLDDGILEDVPDAAVYQGKEKIRKFFGELFVYSPDTKVEAKATFLGKHWAIVEWIWSGTQTGDIEGVIEATGNKFSIRGASIFEFQDGKIKRQSDYYNAGRFLYQLGVKFVFPSGKIVEKKAGE